MIESIKNNLIKEIVKLQSKKYRDKHEQFIIEGFHLVEEAFNAALIETIIVKEGVKCSYQDTTIVSEKVFNHIKTTESSQGILAICAKPKISIEQEQFVLVVDRVQDPGNLGTIIRSCDAFNVDLVVLNEGCVDLYNPKTINSSQGSIFHLPIVKMNALDYIKNYSGKVYGTSLESSLPLNKIEFGEKTCLIVGNEGSGVDQELLKHTDKNIIIEMPGQSESLNVGVATSIALYQISLNRK